MSNERSRPTEVVEDAGARLPSKILDQLLDLGGVADTLEGHEVGRETSDVGGS